MKEMKNMLSRVNNLYRLVMIEGLNGCVGNGVRNNTSGAFGV